MSEINPLRELHKFTNPKLSDQEKDRVCNEIKNKEKEIEILKKQLKEKETELKKLYVDLFWPYYEACGIMVRDENNKRVFKRPEDKD